jgi:hypothetical protein
VLVIGSFALNHWVPDYREPKDIDLICASHDEKDEFLSKLNPTTLSNFKVNTDKNRFAVTSSELGIIELEVTESGKLYQMYYDEHRNESSPDLSIDAHREDIDVPIATPDILFSIKRSHRHYPRMWDKHIHDYHILKSLVFEDVLPEATDVRERETRERYGKLTTPSLEKNNTNFFEDSVKRVFVHDDVHRIMAHRPRPMYEYIRISPDTVKCSLDKFLALGIDDQIRCVLEEAYVIALERAIVPMLYLGGGFTDADRAIKWALMRICTNLTSGWFREFALENYPTIYRTYNADYVSQFLQAVDAGTIQPKALVEKTHN